MCSKCFWGWGVGRRIWVCKPTLKYPLGGDCLQETLSPGPTSPLFPSQRVRVQGKETCFHFGLNWICLEGKAGAGDVCEGKPSSEYSSQEAGGKMCGFHSPSRLLGSVNHHLEVIAPGGYPWVYSHSLALGLSCEEVLPPPLRPPRDGFRPLLRASLHLCPDAAQGGTLLPPHRGQGH